MAVPKGASTGLGWGGGVSRLRTRSAAPWDGDSTPRLPPRRHTALPASLFLLLKGCTVAIFRRLLLAAGRARAVRASARARLVRSNEYCRPAASRLPDGSTRLAMRAPAALAAAPAAAALAAAALAGERYDRRRPLHPRLPSRARSNEYCRPAASRLPDGSTRLAMRAPAALAAAPAAAALAAAALAGKRYDRRRPLHPRLPSRAPSRRARPTLLAHGTRRHSAAENRRCSARSARDLVLSRLDPAIPRVYL